MSTFVKRLRTLAPLSDADVAAIERLPMRRQTIARRHPILAQGARPNFVYTLVSGWAARYEVRRDGSRRITGILLPGDFCGIHAICGAAMDHAVIALTDCEVGTVEQRAFAELARSAPAISHAIWRAKLVEEATLRKWLVYAADARQSIARLLCELHARLTAVGLASGSCCTVPLTQEEIGDALNLTSVHVNRMIQVLRAEELIELAGGQLRIVDAAALQRVAEFDPAYLQPWTAGDEAPPLFGREAKAPSNRQSADWASALSA